MKKKVLIGAGLCAALLAGPAAAQVSVISQPGTIVGSLSAFARLTGYSPATPLYTVPSGKTARVTDIFINTSSFTSSSACNVAIYCSTSTATNSLVFLVQELATAHYPLNNGLACGAGGTITAYSQGNTDAVACYMNQQPSVTLRGYLYTVP